MLTNTGSYTGDDADARGITGIGFQPDLVIIKSSGANAAVFRTSTMTGDNSSEFDTALEINLIESLDTGGFTVGTDARVNSSANTYHWLAVRDNGDGDFEVGTYTGDATDNRNITTSFQAAFVATKGNQAQIGRFRENEDTAEETHLWNTNFTAADEIQTIAATSFQVGTGAAVNANTIVYHWFIFLEVTGECQVGTYTGNATDSRSITGVGFQPIAVFIVNDSQFPTSTDVAFRTSTMSGDACGGITVAQALQADWVQALESDGFQVGLNANVNNNTIVYHWLALAQVSAPVTTVTRGYAFII